MMNRAYAFLNLLSVLFAVFVNYASQMGLLGAPTVGAISRRYESYFTPAPYAFAIWGPIFLALLAFAGYGIYRLTRYRDGNDFIKRSAPWFAFANLLNATWVLSFTHDFIGWSFMIILGLLSCLVVVIRKLDMERWDAPIGIIAFVWWPICLYAGWITVATLANGAVYFRSLGWDGGTLGPETWTLTLILLAAGLNAYLVLSRNMREFAAVGIWALAAIGMRHQGGNWALFLAAMVSAAALGVLIAWHGYRNRATNPFIKLKQRLGAPHRKT